MALQADHFEWVAALGRSDQTIALARDGLVAARVTRRANALGLLDDGWRCQRIAEAFLIDDDTTRGWRRRIERDEIAGVSRFEGGRKRERQSAAQDKALEASVTTILPRTTRPSTTRPTTTRPSTTRVLPRDGF
jgi:hypothetical protein